VSNGFVTTSLGQSKILTQTPEDTTEPTEYGQWITSQTTRLELSDGFFV